MEPHIVFSIVSILSHIIHSQSLKCYYHPQSLPVPLYGHIAVYSNFSNSVYLFGGQNSNAVYKWDLSHSDAWFDAEWITTTPSAFSSFFSYANNAVIVNDIVYFIGMQDVTVASGNIYMFDIKTESWLPNTQLRKPAMPLSHGCLTTNSSHIFMLDGINDNVNELRSPVLQIYEIATNTWTGWSLSGLGEYYGGWRYQYCSMVNNQLYIFGGRTAATPPAYSNEIYKFNALTETMRKLDSTLPIAQSWGVAVQYNHFIYTVGSFPYTTNINVFDTITDTVTNITYEMAQQLSSPGALMLNDKLYIFGGEDNTLSALATVQICDLQLPTKNPIVIPTTSPTTYHTSASPSISLISYDPSSSPSMPPTTYYPSMSPISYDPSTSPFISPTTYYPSIIPSISPTSYAPSPSPITTPTVTRPTVTKPVTNGPTISRLTIEYTTTGSSGSDTTNSTVQSILTSESNMNINETKDNSSSVSATLIVTIIAVAILCLILIFCVLNYVRLRQLSNSNTDGKRKHVKVQSLSSISPISPFSSNHSTNPKCIDGNDVELETINPGNDDDIDTNPNDMSETSGMYRSTHRYAAVPGEIMGSLTTSIVLNDGENEGFEGVAVTDGIDEIINEFSNSEYDSDYDNELYQKGNKKTIGGDDEDETFYQKGNNKTKGSDDDDDEKFYRKGNKKTKGGDDESESDNELYGKGSGNKRTKGSNSQNGNDDILNESDDNQEFLQ